MPTHARNVILLRVLTKENVNVGAVYGVIWGPFNLALFETLAFEIQNPDVAQTIDVTVDIATAIGGPWATSMWNGLMAIGPSETRNPSPPFTKPGQIFIRLSARADGAGINDVVLGVSGLEQRLISGSI